jgi:hypothetical protein
VVDCCGRLVVHWSDVGTSDDIPNPMLSPPPKFALSIFALRGPESSVWDAGKNNYVLVLNPLFGCSFGAGGIC